MNTRHRHGTENGGKNGTEDQMHVDFHVLHPNQNNIHHDHPPKDGRQAKAHIGHPRPAEFNSVRTLPQSFRVNDLFRFVTRLELSKVLAIAPERSAAPTLLDRAAGVFAQGILQLTADRLRVGANITVERGHARGLFVDNIADIGVNSGRLRPQEGPAKFRTKRSNLTTQG